MCSGLLLHLAEELWLLSPQLYTKPLTLHRAVMEYRHSAGILHGDLKPANVLLKSTSADRRGFLCKLCDFGMSRLLDATHATHVSTQTYGVSPYPAPAAKALQRRILISSHDMFNTDWLSPPCVPVLHVYRSLCL